MVVRERAAHHARLQWTAVALEVVWPEWGASIAKLAASKKDRVDGGGSRIHR